MHNNESIYTELIERFSKSEEFLKEEIYTKIEEKLNEAINLAQTYNIDEQEIKEMLDTLLKEE